MLSTLNINGNSHVKCEDSVWIKETEHVIEGGIFDGCSSGINSHWASQLLVYLFTNATNILNSKSVCEHTVLYVLYALRELKVMLGLNVTNFESTALLFYYNKVTKTLFVRSFGDGCYYVNGKEYLIDQNNIPDYLAHHIHKTQKELVEFINKYPIQIYSDVENFKICSDGIKAIVSSQYEDVRNPLDLLLAPPTSKNYLPRMWNILKREHFTLSDDLSIISYATT